MVFIIVWWWSLCLFLSEGVGYFLSHFFDVSFLVILIRLLIVITAWKKSVFGDFLVGIFSHFDWIWRDPVQIREVSSPNAAKYGPEKLQIRTLFTQWMLSLLFKNTVNLFEWSCNFLMFCDCGFIDLFFFYQVL